MGKVTRATAIVDAHVLLVRDAHVLLLKRQNTEFEDGKYCLIAGHLESGESIVHAAAREAFEEVGIRIPAENLRFAHVIHNNSGGHRIGLFFLTEHWIGKPSNSEPVKCSSLEWFPIDKLPLEMIDYQREAVERMFQGSLFSIRGWRR